MKSICLETEGLTLEQLLQQASGDDVVFLTAQGRVRFALLPADEGDQEVLAMTANPELMIYLMECGDRARTRPRKSLREIREKYQAQNGSIPAAGDGGA